MKSVVFTLLKRNLLVAVLLLILFILLRFVPANYLAPWKIFPAVLFTLTLIALFCSLLWANNPLTKKGHFTFAVLLSVLLIPTLAFLLGMLSFKLRWFLTEREYRAQGFQIVEGCNGGAAVGASGDVHTIEQRLKFHSDPSDSYYDANLAIQLTNALALAREKEQVLNEDCRRRGHRETFPWKTNWAVIRQALKASNDALNH